MHINIKNSLHCIIRVVNIQHVHVAATLVAILREVSCKMYVTKTSETSSTKMSNIKI